MADGEKHRQSWLRWITNLLALTLVGMLIGSVVEKVLNKEALEGALALQQEALHGVQAFDPLTLGELVICSMRSVEEGNCGFFDISLAHWGVHSYAVGASVDVFWHLILNTSVTASIFAIAQFIIRFCTVIAFDDDVRNPSIPNWGSRVILSVPILTIIVGLAAGFVTKYIMIGALELFQWLTSFAALCCGTTGLAYAGYTLFVKIAETAAHDAAGKTIEKL